MLDTQKRNASSAGTGEALMTQRTPYEGTPIMSNTSTAARRRNPVPADTATVLRLVPPAAQREGSSTLTLTINPDGTFNHKADIRGDHIEALADAFLTVLSRARGWHKGERSAQLQEGK